MKRSVKRGPGFWEGLGLGAMVAGVLAMLTVTLLTAGSGAPLTPEDAALWRLVARLAVSALALGAVVLVAGAKLGRWR